MKSRSNIMLAALLALSVTACAPALVGAGAAGGYYVAKDERTIGEIASDAAVTARVNTAYARDDVVSAWDINVDTFRGHVTLHGTVPSQDAIDRAVRIARAQRDVESVQAYLEVVPQR
ncbi:MAG TPA: BON domain-containing protein [Rhodocyclaceae bacterium]|jgi:hyperosmotically inducible periplasmic protein|nr:BON domain-containing protein [Rhodocyclaceae bacterium]HRQ48030.1 BON domain-containing protein [Rhodocyclaceae bacterium]